ncbi:hypothetical protein ABL78_7724 [Leptomonas seymouri]|uniref:Uncharacterized protein n=1 Tax=Leptomonas seymouri TaxID=5684 RepID=A0A0N1HTL4_LEPSE|nr:hypothetical protein ABL78_7724 [Leptomonas seymouri]|eukprot:KPI83245.1 hypothetical protein ABL78_7724 [Leptomonas seymouri]
MDSYPSKAQKPCVPIGTCSPVDTCVRPTVAERAANLATSSSSLAGDSSHNGGGAPPQRQQADSTQAAVPNRGQTLQQSDWNPCVTTGAIQELSNGRFTCGHPNTFYLIGDPQHPNVRYLDTTYHVDYNATNGDVSSQRRPGLGVRSKRLMEQALAAAREMKAANDAARQQQLVAAEANVSNASRAFGPNISEYHATICDPQEVLPVLEELANDYQEDEPITVYTGNPHTGKTMVVHGKTPVDPMSSSRFGKHTYFTENKYAY